MHSHQTVLIKSVILPGQHAAADEFAQYRIARDRILIFQGHEEFQILQIALRFGIFRHVRRNLFEQRLGVFFQHGQLVDAMAVEEGVGFGIVRKDVVVFAMPYRRPVVNGGGGASCVRALRMAWR